MTASEEPGSRHSSRNVLEMDKINFIGTSLQMFRLSRPSIVERLQKNLAKEFAVQRGVRQFDEQSSFPFFAKLDLFHEWIFCLSQ